MVHLPALGLTNVRIADQLVISPRTDARHVRRITTTIGVSTGGWAYVPVL